MLHLLPEGGMSPLPVRRESGGKVVAVCLHDGLLMLLLFTLHITHNFSAASISCHC